MQVHIKIKMECRTEVTTNLFCVPSSFVISQQGGVSGTKLSTSFIGCVFTTSVLFERNPKQLLAQKSLMKYLVKFKKMFALLIFQYVQVVQKFWRALMAFYSSGFVRRPQKLDKISPLICNLLTANMNSTWRFHLI